MINSFSFQQISRTGNPDSNSISRQYKLNLLADLWNKIEKTKLKNSEIASQLGYFSSILQR